MTVDQLINAISKWGFARNIIQDATSKDQFVKLVSEVGELADAIAKKDIEKIKDGIGDAIVVLVMIAEIEGVSLHECIELAYNEIKDRKGILYKGTFVKSTDPKYEDIVKLVQGGREAT